MNTKLEAIFSFKCVLENMDRDIEDLWEYVGNMNIDDLSEELNDLDNSHTILANKLDDVIWKILEECK